MTILLRYLHKLEDFFLITSLLTMLGVAVMQIVLRNGFDSGFLWAESFLRILVLWVAMLGAMVATRERNHISIDIVSRYLSGFGELLSRIVVGFSSAAVLATAAYYSIEIIRYEYEDQTIAFGVVPTWICQSIIPFGFAVMALRFLVGIFRSPNDEEAEVREESELDASEEVEQK